MDRDQQIVTAYVKLLRELMELKVSDAPELVLPVPKEELRQIVARSEHPGKHSLSDALEFFRPGGATVLHFITTLVTRPSFVAIAASVVIVIGGGSWFWLLGAFLGAIGALFATFFKVALFEHWSQVSRVKRWAWAFAATFAEWVVVPCWGALWFRLVIVSCLYGLYSSTWVRFSTGGVILAMFSLYLGYFF